MTENNTLVSEAASGNTWFGDLRTAFMREVGSTLGNPFYLTGMLMQPILYLFFFAPVLTGLGPLDANAAGEAYGVFIPALLVQLVLFGGAFVGISLVGEWRAGAFERLFATPASRSALLGGKIARDVCAGLVAVLLVAALSLILGYAMPPLGLAACLVLVAFTNLCISSLSYLVAILTKREDSLAVAVNAVLLPLVLVAGVMVPISFAPDWLRVLARFNPLYCIVEAARAAASLDFGMVYWIGVGVALAVAALSFALATRAFERRA